MTKSKMSDMPQTANGFDVTHGVSDDGTHRLVIRPVMAVKRDFESAEIYNIWGFDIDNAESYDKETYPVGCSGVVAVNFIGFSFYLRDISEIGIIKDCRLFLTTASGSGRCQITSLDEISLTRGEVLASVPDGETVEVNISNIAQIAKDETAMCCIEPAEPFMMRSFYAQGEFAPYITVDYIPNDSVVFGRKYLEKTAGDVSCKTDLLSGIVHVGELLLALGGEKLPMSLSLHHDGGNGENFVRGMDTGLGQSWYTNYHQICYPEYFGDTLCYFLIDSDRISHTFIPALNDNSLWCDSTGTGLMLTPVSGGIKIYDELGNGLLFDSRGRLIRIWMKRSENTEFENTVEYVGTGGKISKITDGMGRVASFEYASNKTTVKLDGAKKIEITQSQNNTDKIQTVTKSGDSSVAATSSVFYLDSQGKIDRITSSGETITLYYYYGSGRVKTVKTNSRGFSAGIKYGYFVTEVTSEKNITQVFDFDKLGEFIASFEKSDVGGKNVNFISREAVMRYGGTLSDKKDVVFEFSGKPFLKLYDVDADTAETSGTYRTQAADVNTYAVFSAIMRSKQGYCVNADAENPIFIELSDSENNVLCTLSFDPYMSGTLFAAKPFKLCGKNSTDCGLLKIRVVVNARGKAFEFFDMQITPLVGSVETLCCGFSTGGGYIGTSDVGNLYFVTDNKTVTANLQTYRYPLYLEDYLANERNMYMSETGKWNMWIDRKRKLIANVENPFADFGDGGILNFVANGTLHFTALNLTDETADARIASYDESARTKYDTDKISVMRQSVKSYERSEEDGALTFTFVKHGYYDILYRLVKQADEKCVQTYTYDSDGFLVRTVKQDATDAAENIVSAAAYYGGYLCEEKDYLLSSEAITEYSYTDMGYLSRSYSPCGFIKDYYYKPCGNGYTAVGATVGDTENTNDFKYSDNRITGLTHNGFGYGFTYNSYNAVSSVKIAGTVYEKMNYTYTDGKDTVKTSYGNGAAVTDTFDKYGRLIKTAATDGSEEYYYSDSPQKAEEATSPDSESLEISSQSKLYKAVDTFVNSRTHLSYDAYGQCASITAKYNRMTFGVSFEYDNRRRLHSENYTFKDNIMNVNGDSIQTVYTYVKGDNSKSDVVCAVETTADGTVYDSRMEKDNLDRVKSETLDINANHGYKKEYSYCKRNPVGGLGEGTTAYLAGETYKTKNGVSFGTRSYGYDLDRDLTSFVKDGTEIVYEYDSAGRLVREKNPFFDSVWYYYYDAGGNIVEKDRYWIENDDPNMQPEYAIGYAYTSAFKDRITSWNNKPYAYDNCGNPTTYKGNAMTWTRGRLLSQYSYDDTDVYMTYGGDGIRRSKEVRERGSLRRYTEYNICDGRLISEHRTQSLQYPADVNLYYIYGVNGMVGLRKNSDTYYFVKNSFGDVEQIRSAQTDELVAYYVYDAWGNHKVFGADGALNTDAEFIGNINPIRYRGYYYDADMSLYYLQTRYYDSETGRFVNLDMIEYLAPDTINGLNLYAYCLNNPVMNTDPYGTWSWKGFWKVLGAVAVIAVAATAVALTAGLAAVTIAGAVGASAITTASVGLAVGTTALVGGAVVGTGELVNQIDEKGVDDINIGSVAIKTVSGGLDSAMIAAAPFTGFGGKAMLAGGRMALSTLSTLAYGLSEGYDYDKIRSNVVRSVGTTAAVSSLMFFSSPGSIINFAMQPITTGLIKAGVALWDILFN